MVAAIVLVDTMFYAAISPLLPYYAHHFHLAKSQAGVLAAAYAAGTLIGSIPAGWLAARLGVRATIITGLGLMVASSLVLAFATSVALLDGARFVQGVGGAASWAAGMAWLIVRAPDNRRAEVIGVTLAAAIAGALLGPVVGTAATQTSPKLVFSVVAALGLGLLLWTLTERAPPATKDTRPQAFAPALRDRRVITGMWLTMLAALLYGTLSVLAPLRLSHLGASNVTVGLAFLAGAAVAGLSSPLVGRVSDRRGWRLPVLAGLWLSTVWVVLLALPRTVAPLFGLVVVADGLFGVSYPPAGALISGGAESAGLDQAYGFGLFNMAWAGGQVIGGAGGAGLAQATADAIPYSLLGALCLITAVTVARQRPAVRAPS
ncbi:MAG: MFS transporter [Solirubrobacterales bacterium]|nr:MFS transporter [Solirubrobacterales bacterium]